MTTIGNLGRYGRAIRRHGASTPKVVVRKFLNRKFRIRSLNDLGLLNRAHEHLSNGDDMGFSQMTTEFLRLSGADLGREDPLSQLLDIVQRRATHELDHDQAVDHMQRTVTYIQASDQPSAILLATSTLTCAVGLFEQGLALEVAALKQLKRKTERETSRRGLYLGTLAALHLEDLDHFISLMSSPKMHWIYSHNSDPATSLTTYAGLLGIRSNAPRRRNASQALPDEGWWTYVNGTDVLLYGPSESDGLEDQDLTSFKVFRSLAPGVLRWPVDGDLVSGRCDVAYANDPGLWFDALLTPEEAEAVQKWRFLVTKGVTGISRSPSASFGFRGAEMHLGLFISGHPLMIPIMMLDVLPAEPKRVLVAGVNFFLAQTPYRSSHRRIEADNVRVNESGSTGQPFERCFSMASHNAFQNRNLVRHLYQVGSIEGDNDFETVMRMTNKTYAEGLAERFGRDAV